MRRSSERGFTLIELMIVVAIIAVAATIAMMSARQSHEKQNLQSIVRQIKDGFEKARSLATLAGGRIGDATTVVWVPNGSCGPEAIFPNVPDQEHLWVTLDPASKVFVYPRSFRVQQIANAPDNVLVDCERIDFSALPIGAQATFAAPAAATAIWFSPGGRAIDAAGNTGPFDVWVQHADTVNLAHVQYGLQILSSGVICDSTGPGGTCHFETED